MGHDKVYGICESKCQVQTVAGYASLAAIGCTEHTPLQAIFTVMDNNTNITYGITSCEGGGDYPINVTRRPDGQGMFQAIVEIKRTDRTAAVRFTYNNHLYIRSIYYNTDSTVLMKDWVKIV